MLIISQKQGHKSLYHDKNSVELRSTDSNFDIEIPFIDIINSLVEGVGIVDSNEQFIFLNDVFVNILEADSIDSLIGKSIMDFIDDRDRDLVHSQAELRRDGVRSQYGVALRTIKGNLKYLDVDVSPIINDNKYVGALARLIDVTSEKTILDSYSRDINKYSFIIDQIGIGVAIINRDMEVLSANKVFRDWFPELNSRNDCICYKTFHDPPKEDVCSYCPVVKSFADGESHFTVTETPTSRGKINFRIWAYPIKDEHDEIVSVAELVEDITEETRQLNERQRQLNLLETLINTIPSPVYYKDSKGIYLGCNEAFANIILGQDKSAIVGKSLYDVAAEFPEKLIRKYQEKDNELINNPGKQYYDSGVLCADGNMREFHFAKATYGNISGEVDGIIGVMIDITEKRRIELELRKQTKILTERLKEQNCLYQILRQANRHNIPVDDFINSVIQHVKVSWQYPEITCVRITVDSEEFKSENYAACDHSLKSDIVKRKGKIGTIEVGYLEDRPEEDIGPFYKEERDLLELIAAKIARFIERKEYEESRIRLNRDLIKSNNNLERALEEAARAKKMLSEIINRYTAMINTVPAVMYLKDKNNTYVEVNEAFCDLAGKAKDQVIGLEDNEVFSSEIASKNSAEDMNIIKNGRRVINREHSFANADGDTRWLSSTKLPMYDEKNEIVGMVGLLQDVTELHLNRQQLIQSDKLAAIGQLAAGVAHEINNPIGYINSNLNFMLKSLGKIEKYLDSGGDDLEKDQLKEICEDFHDAISESIEGTDRVKDIVADLKSFSRVDRTVKEQTDLNEGIRSTLNVVWNELKYKAKINTEYGNIPMVNCMANQVNQVFMNILVNAAHAIDHDKGEITIKTYSRNDRVYISIKDNGTGMPEDSLKKIFEPFYTTKEVGKGTGMGLSLAYDIIKKHNGVIEVKSVEGEGSEFIVMLPVGAPDEDNSDGESNESGT